jgi:nitrite reductase/ring-hydroxylating ferredoxin subunit
VLAWLKLCSLSDLRDREPKSFNVRGRDLVALKLGQKIYVFDRWCTHEQGDMAMATLEGTTLICPDHGSRFNLEWNGKNTLGPDGEPAGTVADLPVFEARVVSTEVQVDL